MSLIDTLRADLLAARKAKNETQKNLLTALVGESTAVGKNNGNRETTDEETVSLIKKFVKNTQDTITTLRSNGRDSALQESELALLEAYVPQQLSEEQLDIYFTGMKNNNVASNLSEAMKFIRVDMAGRYDGRLASTVAKRVFG